MGSSLARRVMKLEAARNGCSACGGRGSLTVVFVARGLPAAEPDRCPACGRSLVVEIHELTMEEWHGREDACA